MFKSLTAYRITDMSSFDALFGVMPTNLLEVKPIVDPDATAWGTIGFTEPRPPFESEGGIYAGANGISLMMVEIRERVLPSGVIKVKLAERVVDIEARQGRKCGRKEIAQLKDDVVAELLPASHIRRKNVRVMIHRGYLIIGTTSGTVVDAILNLLRTVMENSLSLQSVDRDCEVVPFLTRLLLDDTTDACVFTQGESVTLKSESKTATFKDFDLANQAVRDTQSEGLKPVVISALYKDRISFAVTDRLAIKRIKTLDVINDDSSIQDAEDEVAAFDATLTIVANDLVDLLDALVFECGGSYRQAENDEDEL